MPNLTARIDRLKQGTLGAAANYLSSIGIKRSREVTLHHPDKDAGVHIRDDGSLELFAGGARILLMPDGVVYTKGSMVISEGEEVHLLSAAQNVTINGARLNSEVFTKTKSTLFGEEEYPELPVPDSLYWDLPLVVGAPAGPEQQNLMMSDYWKSMKIFTGGPSDKLKGKLEELLNAD